MSVLEKAAREAVVFINDNNGPPDDWDDASIWQEKQAYKVVRAVLMAVRTEFSGAIDQAYYDAAMKVDSGQAPDFYGVLPEGFTAMIDAILSEPQP